MKYAEENSNWISFFYHGVEIIHEFGITGVKENNHFEVIMKDLQETHADFRFESI